ncbi:MAG: toll/interleukin-1 receptor domain-containing protein [Vicinamibacterales bacterium]
MARNRKTSPQPEAPHTVEAKRVTTENPLVFISHDSRDADLAEAFGNLLTDASGGILKSFRSSDRKGTAGIEYGQEWYRAIMQKLDDATDVVALLTSHSVNRPWILYEAGVAKGKLTANDPQAAPRDEAVKRQVQAFRQTVAVLLKDRKKEPAHPAAKVDETSVAKFFEEIKVLVRDVPDRVASELGHDPRMRRMRKRRRFHPAMFEEMMHHPMFLESPDHAGLPILLMFSMLRDEYPWLYELGVQLYRAVQEGNPKAIDRARRAIVDTIEVTRRGPFMHEMMGGPEDDEAMMMLHHFAHSLDRFVRVPGGRGTKAAGKAPEKNE